MANRSFDFGKVKRSFYNTKLKDGTILLVNMPMKKTFEKITKIEELQEDDDAILVYDTMLDLMAEILSNNKQKRQITTEYLEKEKYDIEEITAYIGDYAKFVETIKNNPN